MPESVVTGSPKSDSSSPAGAVVNKICVVGVTTYKLGFLLSSSTGVRSSSDIRLGDRPIYGASVSSSRITGGVGM